MDSSGTSMSVHPQHATGGARGRGALVDGLMSQPEDSVSWDIMTLTTVYLSLTASHRVKESQRLAVGKRV